MAAITINDLNNAKLDVDLIAAIATSPEVSAIDRLGNVRKTLAGAIASVDTAVAATAAGTATNARIAAEAARDAALIQAGVYATVAAGLAAVAEGSYFKVVGTGAVAATEYRKTAGVAVQVAQYPSVSGFQGVGLTFGERFGKEDFSGQLASGGVAIFGQNRVSGDMIGFSVPQGSTGEGTFVTAWIEPSLDLIAKLAGSTIRMRLAANTSDNFKSLKVKTSTAVGQVSRAGVVTNIGTLVRDEQVGTKYYRDVLYTVTKDDTKFGVTVQIKAGGDTSAASFSIYSTTFSIEQVGVADTASGGDILQAAVMAPTTDQVAVLASKSQTAGEKFDTFSSTGSQALNGAALVLQQGRAIGLSIPANVTGASSHIDAYMKFDAAAIADLLGSTLKFKAVAIVSPNFMAEKGVRVDKGVVARRPSGVVSGGTVTRCEAIGDKLFFEATYVVTVDDTEIGPYLQLPGTAVANNAHTLTLSSVTYTVEKYVAAKATSSGDLLADRKMAEAISKALSAANLGYSPLVEEAQTAGVLTAQSDSLTAPYPSVAIVRPSGQLTIPAGSVTFDAPATAQIANEPITVIYSASDGGIPGARLLYQYLSNLVVTRDSDGGVLAAGADYQTKESTGLVYGLRNIADFTAKASYTGYMHRYDLVCADAVTGAISVVKGTDRIIDPEQYRPATPPGKIALYSAYVAKGKVELIPVYRFRNGQELARKGEYAEYLEYCRHGLRKTLRRLRLGQPVRLVGYGDSITAIEGSGNQDQLKAGGNKDRSSYMSRVPNDSRALYPVYDGTDPDFAGSPYVDHRKIGWNWSLVAAMRERYGSAIEYRNWGVGGTTSADTLLSNGRYNGLHPTRLSAMLADGGHLMVLAFGMNELGSADTYANVRKIIETFQAAGGEVIVLTTPQINQWGFLGTTANWLFTHDSLVRAAIDTGSAYVSTRAVEGTGFEGACGLSQQTAAITNLYNHPGPVQLGAIGAALARLVP